VALGYPQSVQGRQSPGLSVERCLTGSLGLGFDRVPSRHAGAPAPCSTTLNPTNIESVILH